MLTHKDYEEIESIVKQVVAEATKHLPTKDEFFTKMDEVMGELQKAREAFDLHVGKHAEIDETHENHDKRLAHIEKRLSTSSSLD